MNSEQEPTMNKGDQSESSSQKREQHIKYPDKKSSGSNADSDQKKYGAGQTKFNKQDQSDDRSKNDIDAKRHPEEQVPDPMECPEKENRNYNDKSDRV